MYTVCMSGTRGGQKRRPSLLELETQTAVGHMWALGTESLPEEQMFLTTELSLPP